MNNALERMLRECESSHFFGEIVIVYAGGTPLTIHRKQTYKLTGTARPEINRETRGSQNEQPREQR